MKRFGFTAVAVALVLTATARANSSRVTVGDAPFFPLDQGNVVIHDGQA